MLVQDTLKSTPLHVRLDRFLFHHHCIFISMRLTLPIEFWHMILQHAPLFPLDTLVQHLGVSLPDVFFQAEDLKKRSCY